MSNKYLWEFSRLRFGLATLGILLLIIMTACAVEGEKETPEVVEVAGPLVTISQPAAGQTLPLGSEVNVLSTSVGERGISRVELLINEQVVRVDANSQPEANTPFIVAQPWRPETPGSYNIQVRAFNTANIAGQSAVVIVNISERAPLVGQESPLAPVQREAGAILPTAAPSPTPTRESTPAPVPTREPTPVPLPTATFAPTGLEPEGRFKEIWDELGGSRSPLGDPTEPEAHERDFAKQYFEGGLMLWLDNPAGDNTIWVMTDPLADFQSGGSWTRFADRWEGGEEYSCETARKNEGRGPVRGFGQVWCDQPEVMAGLGNPLEPEAGSSGQPPYSLVQFFQGGVMIYNPLNSGVVVLFNGDGWRKFGE